MEETKMITVEPIDEPIISRLVKEGEVIQDTDYLPWNKFMYNVALLDMDMKEVDHRTLYIYGDYFYPYRGIWPLSSMQGLPIHHLEPGIYWDEKEERLVRVEPSTEKEREEYQYIGKLERADLRMITEVCNSGEVNAMIPLPESSKSFITPVSPSDDILKRLMKEAISAKGVTIDGFRDGFIDKNALFNFKQVIKGSNKLSMLLFDRGAAALNLKYSIILEDKDPSKPVGRALVTPLIASSEDTYEV